MASIDEREVTAPTSPTVDVLERQLHRTCDQLQLIQDRIELLSIREKRCRESATSSGIQSVEIQLQSLRGVYNAFYKCADRQARKLQRKMNSRRQQRQSREEAVDNVRSP